MARTTGIMIQDGNTIDWKNDGTEAVAVGTIVMVGNVAGIAQKTIAAGAEGALAVTGVYECDAVKADAAAQGAPLYFKDGKLTVNGTGGLVQAGICWAAKAANTEKVIIKINS